MSEKLITRKDVVSFFYILSICLAILAVVVWIKHMDFRLVPALFFLAMGTFFFGKFFEMGEEEDENEYGDDDDDW
ncbi:MAG: hypothetical protein JW944_06215 [Deltaproteobacteria bacterium]|nr:hypothetical protein [Deltaproteobacteria bacterium]